MHRITAWFLFVFGVLGFTSNLSAETYPCGDPPDKLAKVGVSASSAVSMTQDKSAKECRISINGETVGSPPQDQVVRAVNMFRNDGRAFAALASKSTDEYVNALAIMLMAVAPVNRVPDEVLNELRTRKSILDECFAGLAQDRPVEVKRAGDVICQVWDVPRNDGASKQLDRDHAMSISSRTLEVILSWGNKQYVSRAYLPWRMLKMAPLPAGCP